MHDKRKLIGVINEGTKAVQFTIFKSDPHYQELCSHEIKVTQICPKERWVEQNPTEILNTALECAQLALDKLPEPFIPADIVAIGITNQRETVIVWDKNTGKPLYNAILWSDARTEETVETILDEIPNRDPNYFKEISGLPISPYFSAIKLKWLYDHVPEIRLAILNKTCLIGTIDSWIVWNLTGGVNQGLHITDVTNASRTLLMNLDTLNWDPKILDYFNIPVEVLPKICSSSEVYGEINHESVLNGIPICAIMGNQQSSLVGQMCFQKGQLKNSYRNACFLMCNIGEKKVLSKHGLVTTVAYQLGKDKRPVYALEGSVAVGGTALHWLETRMGLFKKDENSEVLASSVYSTGDVYFVPAFNGLYAPYWKTDAKGIICGLTAFTTRSHVIRAALEAICFQTHDILSAFELDAGVKLTKIHVDGPMTKNNLLMQLQADISGIPVLRSKFINTAALGVALAAGQAIGMDMCCLSNGYEECITMKKILPTYDIYKPLTSESERNKRYNKWKMAIERASHVYVSEPK